MDEDNSCQSGAVQGMEREGKKEKEGGERGQRGGGQKSTESERERERKQEVNLFIHVEIILAKTATTFIP